MTGKTKKAIIIAGSILSAITAILSNIVASYLPDWISPYMWLSWPILLTCVFLLTILFLYQNNVSNSENISYEIRKETFSNTMQTNTNENRIIQNDNQEIERKNNLLIPVDNNPQEKNHKKTVKSVLKNNFGSEDTIVAYTENSVYKINAAEKASYYIVSGGLFDKKGPSPYQTRIIGCRRWGDENSFKNEKIYNEYIASCNMSILFSNGIITTPVQKIILKK